MDVNRIVKEINTSISSAKNIISTMSEDEIIELRAELEASKTHFGKWMNSFMVFFAGILAILALKSEWANECLIAGLLVIDTGALIIHCVVECKNAKKVRALSILNDCLESDERRNDSLSNDVVMENYEQLEQRQREERERMLEEWKNKQNYANAQVALFQESLSVSGNNSREIHNEIDTRC